jgi:ring-1,2-phenylacetyl-CoA epoxidase subunit PaaC
MNNSLFLYTVHLADNALMMGQRNSEWTGHGPVLEQDIAITNIALDYLGQARNFYQYAAEIFNGAGEKDKEEMDALLPAPWKEFGRPLEEDDLAFLREERQYRNVLLTELPKGDWAESVLRQFFFSAFQFLQYDVLQKSRDSRLSAIAEKSLKEVAYHQRWSAEWVIRLGDGTEESRTRIKNALVHQWPFTGELFHPVPFESQLAERGLAPDPADLRNAWINKINTILSEAELEMPEAGWMQDGGKKGIHTEYLGYLLAEMQYMQRTFPNMTW